MPTYSYLCPVCRWAGDRVVRIAMRDLQRCEHCDTELYKLVSSALFKFTGRVTPGGGPDRFTADMLGIPLKELPDGLRTPEQPK